MKLDNEHQRMMLIEVINVATFPGKHAEEVADLLRALRGAEIEAAEVKSDAER